MEAQKLIDKMTNDLGTPEITLWQVLSYLALAAWNAPWFWFVVVALLGGFAALAHMDSDPASRFTFSAGVRNIFNRMVISIFIGVMVWYAAEGMGYAASPFSRLAAGIGGYGGVKTIELMIEIASDFINKWRAGKGA